MSCHLPKSWAALAQTLGRTLSGFPRKDSSYLVKNCQKNFPKSCQDEVITVSASSARLFKTSISELIPHKCHLKTNVQCLNTYSPQSFFFMCL